MHKNSDSDLDLKQFLHNWTKVVKIFLDLIMKYQISIVFMIVIKISNYYNIFV